jgi:hypothetical protein
MNREQQIKDYSAWAEYVDPQGIVSEDEFCRMTPSEKMEIIEAVFGPDADAADADNSADADASAR